MLQCSFRVGRLMFVSLWQFLEYKMRADDPGEVPRVVSVAECGGYPGGTVDPGGRSG